MKEFIYEDVKYQIDPSGKVYGGGDLDENNKIILIDKDIPDKFHQGIAIHEIEERKLIKKGHSYVYSHNEAQKIELEFYQKIYGQDEGIKILEEEERLVLTITSRRAAPRKTKKIVAIKDVNIPSIEMTMIRQFTYEGETYLIDNSNKLIGALVDLCEKEKTIYIDWNVPERFFEGLAIYEIESRKAIKQGLSYGQADELSSKKELAYYQSKYGLEEGVELFDEEIKFQIWKYQTEKKELNQNGGHKVIYDKGEILPK